MSRIPNNLKHFKIMILSLNSERFQNEPDSLRIIKPAGGEKIKNKIMRIGIITITMLIGTSAQLLFAMPGKGQSLDKVEITVGFKNESIVQAFKTIEAKTPFHFMYRHDEVDHIKNLNLPKSKRNVAEILKYLLTGSKLTFQQVDYQVLIMESMNTQASEEMPLNTIVRELVAQVVSGRVTNPRGEPLSGVSITIKGSTVGTSSDGSGNYSINVQANDVLVFSYVGYLSKEVTVGSQQVINVQLQEDAKQLSDVVVTALGISREKKALPYAVTVVNGESFTKAREVNIGNALSGKIAGVNATRTATGPGGSSRVIIRGNGSLGGNNQPLYVINGVPIDNTNFGSAGQWGGFDAGDGLSSIDPDNIETITVLKGGTAAALYGSRAANGVILITTKTGKNQQGIGVEYNTTYTVEAPSSFSDYQYEYGSGNHGQKPANISEAIENGTVSWGGKLDGSMVMQPDSVERPYVAQKNNIKNFYNTGNSFSNSIALTGGNEVARFRFSASNLDNNSVIPNTSLNRKVFSLDVSGNLMKKVEFKANVQYNIEQGYNRPYVSDQPYNVNSAPQLMATNLDIRILEPGFNEEGYEALWHKGDANNPYFIVEKVKNHDKRNRLMGSFSAQYNIDDHFYMRGRFGIDYYNVVSEAIIPTGIQYWTPSMTSSKLVTYETNVEGIIGYKNNFGDISVNALAGGNQMHHVIDGINLSSGKFNVPFQYFITNGTGQTFSLNYRENAINSLFASADVGYKNFLFLSLTGRNDWFSTLPVQSNNIFYPSAGLSFVFSEAWNNRPSWLNLGKIRASWAQVGGGAPDPYGLNLVYVAQPVQALDQPLMGINGNSIPNNTIKPYTSTTTELGLELRTLNNRLGLDLAVYERRTTNDIVNASVSSTTGYSNVLLNVGEMRNRGIELLLTGTPVQTASGFNWDASFNMAYNVNTVVRIAEGLTSLLLPEGQVRTKNAFIYHFEGMPFGQIAGYRILTDAKGNKVYDKASGLPVKSEFMSLGNGTPPLTLGLTNTFNYKRLSFSFLLDGKFGGKLYSATNAYAAQWGLSKKTVENGIREKGIALTGVDTDGNPYSATIPAQTYFQYTALNITDDFVYDASFIKLRQLVLGYTLPNSLIAKTPFKAASISLVARNLLLLYSEIPNIDPESTYNNSNAQGLEMYGVPSTRSYGINLMFRL
jgi:TonB-linked SusC/RagA family outer membrane protein